MTDVAAQGRAFEEVFFDLIGRLVEKHLGWELLEHRLQPAGAQFGKDIQTTFRTPDGRLFRWHIECKSHKPGNAVTKEELLPKLFDLWRSEHAIDVWCVALAHVEVGNAIDEMLAALGTQLSLPFEIVQLSRQRGRINELFALEPNLDELLYPAHDTRQLDDDEISRRLAAFERFLLDASYATREPRDGAWQLVVPHRVPVEPDSERFARAYLRGFEPPGWEAIKYGWAASRRSTVDRLIERFRSCEPGFSHTWLIGPAGEGKSTALREFAWTLAADKPSALVLWATASSQKVLIPHDWLELLPVGSEVVLCVDGTETLVGVASLRRSSMHLAVRDNVVFGAFVDRGVTQWKSTARRDLAKWTRPADVEQIVPLAPGEVADLVSRLVERRLVRPEAAATAASRIRAASGTEHSPGTSWLLPTMMELTDPKDRNFEQILESVLIQLQSNGHYESALLLLAAALVQASGGGLPESIAELLVASSPGGLASALNELATELDAQNLGVWEPGAASLSHLLTHHRVVAEAFVHIAISSPPQRQIFLETCADLAAVGASHLDEFSDLPAQHFRILDTAERYLVREVRAYEPASRLLQAWIELDPEQRNFLAMHRLGVCYRDWLTDALGGKDPDLAFARNLATSTRAVFQWSLDTAERVLADQMACPPRLWRDRARSKAMIFHAWGALEDVVGQHLEGTPAFRQAVLFSLLSATPTRRRDQVLSCGTLAFHLIHLQEFELAAMVTSALIQLDPTNFAVAPQRAALKAAGHEVPVGGVKLLDRVIAHICTELLLSEDAQLMWPKTYLERVRRLLEVVDVARLWVPAPSELGEARDLLVKSRSSGDNESAPT